VFNFGLFVTAVSVVAVAVDAVAEAGDWSLPP